MGSFGVWASYFFENEGATVSVTSNRLLWNAREVSPSKSCSVACWSWTDDGWFQQEGATSFTSRRSLVILHYKIPSRVIFLRSDIGWHPCSPNLNLWDFFLWGYVKSKVYEHRPLALEHPKAAITEEINAIPHNMLERMMVNFRERLQNCIDLAVATWATQFWKPREVMN